MKEGRRKKEEGRRKKEVGCDDVEVQSVGRWELEDVTITFAWKSTLVE